MIEASLLPGSISMWLVELHKEAWWTQASWIFSWCLTPSRASISRGPGWSLESHMIQPWKSHDPALEVTCYHVGTLRTGSSVHWFRGRIFLETSYHRIRAFPSGSVVRTHLQCRSLRRYGLDPWVTKIPWRRAWQPTPVFLPGESHGQRSLVGYNPWGHKESDTTEAT